MTSLNPASSVPLYAQLADDLLSQIRHGRWGVGERLPSEHALAERYGVGRPTVRQATDTLRRRGVIERRRGAGTFVRELTAQVDLFSLSGTLASFSEQGIRLETKWVEAPCLAPSPEAFERCRGRQAYSLARCGWVDGKAVLFESIWLDPLVFPGIDTLDLEGRSLSQSVREQFRLEAFSAEQRFRVAPARGRSAHWLGLQEGTLLLQVDRYLDFPTASAAVFVRMDCCSERITFTQRIGAEHG